MSAIDDEPTKEELAAAESLAKHVDTVLKGDPLPPVLGAEERDLAELSGMIHAAHSESTLDPAREASIIEAALTQGAGVDADNELARARAKRGRRWPWALAGAVAAAAIVLLVMRATPDAKKQAPASVARVMELPLSEQSRPGDAVVGQIAREASGAARSRLDALYGDRLTGYRSLQYRKLVGE